MRYYAIIVAGGSGSRMGSAVPKQFLDLAGEPVLMHTIRAFYRSEYRPLILLALHPDFHQHWKDLCKKHDFRIPVQLAAGGKTRYDSVKNALGCIEDNEEALVAIQDGVRPLTPDNVITEAYRTAAASGNAVTAIKASDSIRRSTDGGQHSQAMNRKEIYLVQTPQTFRSSVLKAAYLQPYSSNFTDDASVVESAGNRIHLVPGDPANIKITFPADLPQAELLLKQKNLA